MGITAKKQQPKVATISLLNCISGEMSEVTKTPFTIGSAQDSDLAIGGPGVCAEHCAFLSEQGSTILVKRDPAAKMWVNGHLENSISVPASDDFSLQVGFHLFAANLSSDQAAWRSKIQLGNWLLKSPGQQALEGPFDLGELEQLARKRDLDRYETVAGLVGAGVGFRLSQLFAKNGAGPPEIPTEAKGPRKVDPEHGEFTCPSCWLRFDAGDLMHVAVHASLDNDEVLGDEFMQRFFATPETGYNDRGQALDKEGMACTDTACPHCRKVLPPGFLDVPHEIMSIVGAPQAGKSYYLSVLVKVLQGSLFKHFGVAFVDADPKGNAMLNEMKNRLFTGSKPEDVYLAKTRLQGEMYEEFPRFGRKVRLPRPFVYSLSKTIDTNQACSLIFYDNAGEHFQPDIDVNLSPGAQHLASSSGIFFLFDPTYSTAFRKKLVDHADPQFKKSDHVDQQDIILAEMAVRIRKERGLDRRRKIETPLAMIVGKCDSWMHLLGEVKLADTFVSNGSLNLEAVKKNSEIVRSLLLDLCPEIVATTESLASDIMYFPVSAFGHCPVEFSLKGEKHLAPDPNSMNPLFIDIPTLWVLSRIHGELVPSTG